MGQRWIHYRPWQAKFVPCERLLIHWVIFVKLLSLEIAFVGKAKDSSRVQTNPVSEVKSQKFGTTTCSLGYTWCIQQTVSASLHQVLTACKMLEFCSDRICHNIQPCMFGECLPPKNSVLQLIHRVEFFNVLFQKSHSLLIKISQSGLNTKLIFRYIALYGIKDIYLSHENNHLVNSRPETLVIWAKHAINEQRSITRLLNILLCHNITLRDATLTLEITDTRAFVWRGGTTRCMFLR